MMVSLGRCRAWVGNCTQWGSVHSAVRQHWVAVGQLDGKKQWQIQVQQVQKTQPQGSSGNGGGAGDAGTSCVGDQGQWQSRAAQEGRASPG